MDVKLVFFLLAKLAKYFSLTLLVPLLVAIFGDVQHIYVFAIALGVTLSVYYHCRRRGELKIHIHFHIKDAIAFVTAGWLMICLLGAVPYLLYGSFGILGAFFESVSGFTTTGFSVLTPAEAGNLSLSMSVWRYLTHWMGGMTIIMLFVIMLPQMSAGGSYLFNAELPDSFVERTVPRIKDAAKLLFALYVGMTGLEILLLILAGVPFWKSFELSMATISTGGFDQSIGINEFDVVMVKIIVMIFMILSSISFAIYHRLWRGDWHILEEDVEYRYFLRIIGVAAVAIVLNLWLTGTMNFGNSVQYGLFEAVSMGSTTGFVCADYAAWPPLSRYLLFLLMFMGGCSGSSAGGIKISRIVILCKAAWGELLRTLHPQIVYTVKMGNKVITPTIVGNITRFFFLYILVFMVLSIMISLEGLSIADSISIIAACMSNVGPAFSILGEQASFSQMSCYAKLVSIIAMLLGRLEIVTLLAILRTEFWQKKTSW